MDLEGSASDSGCKTSVRRTEKARWEAGGVQAKLTVKTAGCFESQGVRRPAETGVYWSIELGTHGKKTVVLSGPIVVLAGLCILHVVRREAIGGDSVLTLLRSMCICGGCGSRIVHSTGTFVAFCFSRHCSHVVNLLHCDVWCYQWPNRVALGSNSWHR